MEDLRERLQDLAVDLNGMTELCDLIIGRMDDVPGALLLLVRNLERARQEVDELEVLASHGSK